MSEDTTQYVRKNGKHVKVIGGLSLASVLAAIAVWGFASRTFVTADKFDGRVEKVELRFSTLEKAMTRLDDNMVGKDVYNALTSQMKDLKDEMRENRTQMEALRLVVMQSLRRNNSNQ